MITGSVKKLAPWIKSLIPVLALALVSAGVPAADKPTPINRLLKPHTNEDRLLKEDGIHDPANKELGKLKEPTKELQHLDKTYSGNFVDWGSSLKKGLIKPQYDSKDPSKQALPMDLNIVFAVKGSIGNVLFPHSAHLQWLECDNCHTAIFLPQKGANKISMNMILRGQSCGVCHGSVAFPVNDCERCHSQKK